MNFSADWEQRYQENTHLSIWPWSDVVSLVRRYCPQLGAGSRVLELGCGAGANIPFFQSLGVDYYGIDGSSALVARLRCRFPDFEAQLVAADFTLSQPFEKGFDLVLDRAALTHNSTAAIESGLAIAWDVLKDGCHFIGVDWFSTLHAEFQEGNLCDDEFTRSGFESGTFAGTGRVHFSDLGHLRKLFYRFEVKYLEEKLSKIVLPVPQDLATWNVVAIKPFKSEVL